MPKKKIDRSKLPVYEIVIDMNDQTTGVKMVSLLSDPAIEVQGMYFAKPKGLITPPCHQDYYGIDNCQCDIIDGVWYTGDNPCDFCLENKEKWDALNISFKNQEFSANEEKKIIVGPVLIPNKKIFRKDDKTGTEYYVVFTPEVIDHIVEKFNKQNNNRAINIDHTNRMAPAYLKENWQVQDPVYDKSKLYGYSLPVSSWFWMVKIEDDAFWQTEVKELGKYSFSIEGILGQKLMQFGLQKTDNDFHLVKQLDDLLLKEYAKFLLKE